jgi:hypothetical protein
MKTCGDVVLEHMRMDFESTSDVLEALDLPADTFIASEELLVTAGQLNGAANLYWVALKLLKEARERPQAAGA